ncbi:glycosyltransferase family 2 protein [Neobacillus ginsengisoli]|uniref:Glycosyltransferase involved in cell wall biosynthesis n=1 Tax=Neobacillus ginsengisoli TaxID=904295 RepID=A0ABT9XT96_9BACI|nr:glycosyltransferase [Neobacillus ginsengisoli]MDQ0198773.1 glycosyltransferase involved in cell wall biosynthesis [Neobacillus ginsengisoli]
MAYKISIIVPVYNVEKYLVKCIDSILNQTFSDFELILVNDGSTDKSGEICDEYSKIDKRIKVVHKKNGGLSSARNAGIDLAKGEYIAFVDSDDYIHKRMYEVLYNNAIINSSDIIICDFTVANEGVFYDTSNLNIDIVAQNFSNIESLNKLYTSKGISFIVAWNKLYKRELFNDIRYEKGRIHEDEFIIHQILYKSSKVTYLPIKLYYYLQTNNSIIRSPYNIKRLDLVYALKERVDFFSEVKQTKLQQLAETNFVQSFFLNYYKAKYNVSNNNKELRQLKKVFSLSVGPLLVNPFFNKKEKILWLLFVLNPLLYEIYHKIKKIKIN